MTRLIYMRAINILVPPLVEICIEMFNENMPPELVSFGSSLSCEIGHADVYPDSRGLSQESSRVLSQESFSRARSQESASLVSCQIIVDSPDNINFLDYQSFCATLVFGVKLQRRSSGICHSSQAEAIVTQASQWQTPCLVTPCLMTPCLVTPCLMTPCLMTP